VVHTGAGASDDESYPPPDGTWTSRGSPGGDEAVATAGSGGQPGAGGQPGVGGGSSESGGEGGQGPLVCAAGFADCDADAANGCEADLASNREHCAACGNECMNLAQAVGVCDAGQCTNECLWGFADCDGPAANTGCEVWYCGCTDPCTCSMATCSANTTATDAAEIALFTTDPTTLYWTTKNGHIRRVPKNGGPPTTILTGEAELHAIAVDGTTLYFSRGTNATSAVKSMPIDGGVPTVLASVPDTINPGRLVVAGDYLYFACGPTAQYDGSMRRIPKNGGPVEIIIDNIPGERGYAIDGDYIYYAGVMGGPANDYISRIAIADGAETVLTSGYEDLLDIAVDATHVYFVSKAPDPSYYVHAAVWKLAKQGGPPTLVGTTHAWLWSIAVDAQHIYLAQQATIYNAPWAGPTGILRFPLNGGFVEVLANDNIDPREIILDGADLFYIDDVFGGPAKLLRIAK
jgi:hypothetical protein